MIKRKHIKDRSESKYLIINQEFTNQLLEVLNQLDGDEKLWYFYQVSEPLNWDQKFNKIDKQEKKGFLIETNNIAIASENVEDFLNLICYQKLMQFVKNHLSLVENQWFYYPDDLVLQMICCQWAIDIVINIKLNRDLNKYDEQQIKSIDHFIDDIFQLMIVGWTWEGYDTRIDWMQFKNKWVDKINKDKIKGIGITFMSNDFKNPVIQIKTMIDKKEYYFSNQLKDVLNPNALLWQYLEKYQLDV